MTPASPRTCRPVPADLLHELAEHARRAGARLRPAHDPGLHARLAGALADAARHQQQAPGYVTELERWTHRYTGSHDGIDPGNLVTGGPLPPAAARPPL